MKLNKKGYMLVEIVISFSIAISIMFYLMNLTYKFKNNSEDIYQSTIYLKDKVSITKNIMNDLERGKIVSINNPQTQENITTIDFSIKLFSGAIENRRITIEKENGKVTIYYGKLNGNTYDTNDISYYQKKLESSLVVNNIKLNQSSQNDSLSIIIPLSTLYTKEVLSIKLFLEEDKQPILQKVTPDYNEKIWKYKETATKIIFDNKLNPPSGAIETFDISSLGNGTVMAYVVRNEDGTTYTIHIQGKDTIYTNLDSSYLFSNFSNLTSIEGIEYLDTSLTNNMSYMFNNDNSLNTIDISIFKTFDVTTMKNMFANCSSLTSLNLNNFYTENVKEMESMFEKNTNLENIYISDNWNTENVENSKDMFKECTKLPNYNPEIVDKTKANYSEDGYLKKAD